jgi:hypothetical protein
MASFSPLTARSEFKKRSGVANFDLNTLHVSCGNPECQKTVPSDMKWHCGYCEHPNRRTGLYSFLNKCQDCKKEPKSFLCPYCQDINFLDRDRSASNPARLFVEVKKGPPKAPVPQEHPRAKKRRAHADLIEDIDQEIAVEKRKAELAQIKSATEPKTAKTAREKLKETVKARLGQRTDLAAIIKELRKEEAERCAGDPEGLQDANDALDSIREELI